MDDAQRVRFWLAAVAVTILNIGIWFFFSTSGDGPTPVRILHSTGSAQFEQTGSLKIRFDRDIFTDQTKGEILSPSPLRIEPALKGKWIIRANDTIAFEPDSPPPAGHVYRVMQVEGHPLFDYYSIQKNSLPVLKYKPLHCNYLRLIYNRNPYSAGDGPSQISTIEIDFNQPITKADLLEHLTVVTATKQLDITISNTSLANRYRIDVPTNPKDTLHILINKDLTGHGAELGLSTNIDKTINIPPGLHVVRIYGNTSWRDDEPSVVLSFDRQLHTTQSNPSITITPDIGAVRMRTSGRRITLTGAFIRGLEYTVNLAPPLLAQDGSLLKSSIQRTVTIPELRPFLQFEASSGRLGTKGAFELALQAHRVQQAKFTIHRLLDRHIPTYLSGVMSNWEVLDLGELVSETTIDIPISMSGPIVEYAISLDSFIDKVPGVYWVTIQDIDSRWTRDSMLLHVGDLGLDVHTDSTSILAWVTQVETGQGANEVEVIAYSNNRSELARGSTDEDGLVRLNVNPKRCALVTAIRDGELAFVHVKEAKGLDDQKMAGSAWAGPLDIALYADRGVHRPGETIHITGTVRTSDGKVPTSIPLELRMTRPDKRVMMTKAVLTDPEQGMFQLSIPTRPDDPTGNWIATMHLPGDDVAITTIPCPIMAFMPVRLKVEATPISADVAGDVQVEASYLHGAPAAGLQTTCSTLFRAIRYTDDRYPKHTFEDPPITKQVKQYAKASLDAKGKHAFSIKVPPLPGNWRGDVETTVIELGGRASTARTQIHRQTAAYHLGLLAQGGALHGTDASIVVDVVLLDGEGEAQTSNTLEAHLYSVDHSWQLVDAGKNKRRWKSIEVTQPVKNINLLFTPGAGNSLTCTLPPLPIGTYRFIATEKQASVSIDLHIADDDASGRMSADKPNQLELIAEDELVQPGMHTSVLIRGAFPGLVLFTVETNTIEHWEIVEITGDGVRVPFVVPESVRDTCFIGATLLRALDPTRKEWLPLRARGATRLQVDTKQHELDLKITSTASARPGDLVEIALHVPQCAEQADDAVAPAPLVHLWAVDEGALLATDWSVPNLVSYFLKKRRRTIATVGTTEQLLTDFDRPVSTDRIGGDAASRFREPVPIRQLETAVLWKTTQPLPKDGVFKLALLMPKIDGAMRIMAVVVDGDQYGNAQHLVAVQAPLQWVAATPRTAAPGDVMTIPVRLQNNTDAQVTVQLSLKTGDELHGQLSHAQVELPVHGEGSTTLTLTASGIGSGSLELLATPVDEQSSMQPAILKRSIAVRPPHGREQNVYRIRVEPGETVQVVRDRSLETLAGHITVVAGALPTVDLKPAFDALVEYPYGCAEQTGSRIEGLLAALNMPESISGAPHTLLHAWASGGLQRLYWMQRFDGSMPYWRGGDANNWLTLRTAIVVMKARDQGIEFPDGLLKGLLANTIRIARPANSTSNLDLAALACRVLARGDAPDKALIATLASKSSKLNLESRAHLADACVAVGDLETAKSLVDTFTTPDSLESDDGGRLSSSVLQCAIALEVLTRIAPLHPIAAELVRYIDAARTVHGWRTTYENAAAISALSSWHSLQSHEGVASGRIKISGKTIDLNSNEPVFVSFDVTEDASQTEMITSTGTSPFTVLVMSSGIPIHAHALPIKEDTIQILRTWKNSAGEIINTDTPIIAGDLITVDLEVRSSSGFVYNNVAIVDVLPGGMEFELPALATSAKQDKTSMVNVDQVEFRDDRLLVFASLDSNPRKVRYLMRAIVPGTWAVPAPDALSMYNPDAHGRGASGIVKIELE